MELFDCDLVNGTDYPWFDPFVAIGHIVFAHITEDDKRNIPERNARRLLEERVNGT